MHLTYAALRQPSGSALYATYVDWDIDNDARLGCLASYFDMGWFSLDVVAVARIRI